MRDPGTRLGSGWTEAEVIRAFPSRTQSRDAHVRQVFAPSPAKRNQLLGREVPGLSQCKMNGELDTSASHTSPQMQQQEGRGSLCTTHILAQSNSLLKYVPEL